jgi:hypothetical protein
MIGFAHFLDNALHPLQLYLIGAAILVWIISAVSMSRSLARKSWILGAPRERPRGFLIGIVVFGAIIGGEFALSGLIGLGARMEIEPLLFGKIDAVTVNGTPIPDPGPLLASLRDMFRSSMAHHSHPTTCYHVVVRGEAGSLELTPCRDSDDPHEYWVFYPSFHATRLNAVGHAFTDALDKM